MNITELQGKTLTGIEKKEDEILFTVGEITYIMYHSQDCCESVVVEDVVGNLEDLVGAPITLATETTSNDSPKEDSDDSHTWTFYNIATKYGHVTIRWYGESNGYYSEGVDFEILKNND